MKERPRRAARPVDVVVMGASLGGLYACQRLLARLPADLPVAVALVQHRQPDVESGLAHLLGLHSSLPVSEPDDKEPIKPGHVYLAPINYHLLIDGDRFALSTEEPVLFARPSIDVLFSSAAEARRERALAVALTSASDDGADGAADIKRRGGRVLVQDPAEAESEILPRAVIARASPDAVLRLDQIPAALVEWCRQLKLTPRI